MKLVLTIFNQPAYAASLDVVLTDVAHYQTQCFRLYGQKHLGWIQIDY